MSPSVFFALQLSSCQYVLAISYDISLSTTLRITGQPMMNQESILTNSMLLLQKTGGLELLYQKSSVEPD
jgi:hypothetical protein